MALRLTCRACKRPIEQPPAIFTGPPDVLGKVQQSPLCRTCAHRIQGLFPALERRARGDRQGRPFAGRALVPSLRKAG